MVKLSEILILGQFLSLSFKEQWELVNKFHQSNIFCNLSWLEILQTISKIIPNKNKHYSDDRIKEIVADRQFINQLSENTITLDDHDYPSLWLEMPQPPLLIYYSGHRNLLSLPCISIVGTRKMTPYGANFVSKFVGACNEMGWVCVSGMAKGIDSQVHHSAINDPKGQTIGIIATGLFQCYPRENINLQEQMMAEQLVLSEYLPFSEPKKHTFVMRNRLVAGISPVTVVVEAAERSGSLITANYALQFNREVFALPGNIDASQSQGCNQLIEAGAIPIWSLNEVMDNLEIIMSHHHEFFS